MLLRSCPGWLNLFQLNVWLLEVACSYKLFKQRGESIDKGELIVEKNVAVAVAITATVCQCKPVSKSLTTTFSRKFWKKDFEATIDLKTSSQLTFTYSKLTIETLEKTVKLKLKIRTLEWRHWRHYGVFIVNF